MIPDKTEERSVPICIPYERTFILERTLQRGLSAIAEHLVDFRLRVLKADGRRSKFLVRETRTRNLVQEIGPCVISSRTSFFSYEKLG